MKNFKFIIPAALILLLAACDKGEITQEPEISTIDFENVQLIPSTGGYTNILWGKEKAQDDGNGNNVYDAILYTEKDADFGSYFNDFAGGEWPYDSWGGFAFSSNKILDDTEDPLDYRYQFSAYVTQTSKFAIAFDMGGWNDAVYERPFITFKKEISPVSVRIANSNKAYHYCVKNKNGISGFYFKLIITGSKGSAETGKVEVEMAGDGKVLSDWKEVNLETLGKVDKITFSFESNDSDPVYGINVPAFFCIDDVKYSVE